MVLQGRSRRADGAMPAQLFCENEANAQRLFGSRSSALPQGRDQRPRDPRRGNRQPSSGGHESGVLVPGRGGPGRNRGTVAAAGAGAAADLTVFGVAFDEVLSQRRAEADAFYAELTPAGTSPEDAMIMRQGFAGMIWEAVLPLRRRPLARRRPGSTAPAPGRQYGRNAHWVTWTLTT